MAPANPLRADMRQWGANIAANPRLIRYAKGPAVDTVGIELFGH